MTRKGRTAAGTKRKAAVWLVVLAMMVSLGAGTMAVMADADPVSEDPAAATVTETASPAEEGAAEEAAGTEEGAAEDQALTEQDTPAATEEAAQETDENSTAGEQEQSGDAVESPAAQPAEDPQPSDKPGTVKTQDQRKDGITINLFDYDLGEGTSGDAWSNSPTSAAVNYWPEGGINSLTNLKFFGHGGDPVVEGGNSNRYTGGSIARQGIVKPLLSGDNNDGYPVMNDFGQMDLSNLFSTEGNSYKTVYENVYGLFQKDGAGNYTFNSDSNYAYYDPEQGNGGSFKVYDGTYKVYETNEAGIPEGAEKTMNVGYFPFDDYDENKDDVAPALTEGLKNPYNHQHGLTMEGSFTLPADGTADGQDVVFHFSGDDDAWLFVDGVLVLDIGGLHQPVGGNVNFTTGKVTVDAAVPMSPYNTVPDYDQNKTIGTNNTLNAIFKAAGKEWDPKAEHSYKFFYLERGGCYSNLALETNLWKVAGVKVDVEKVWADAAEADHSEDSVEVQLMKAVGDEEPQPVAGETLTLSEKNNWKDSFTNLPAEDEQGNKIKYSVEETPFPGYKATYKQGGKAAKTNTYWVPADPSTLQNGEKYAITTPNWQSGNAPLILTAADNTVTTEGVSIEEQAVPGKDEKLKDDSSQYTKILKEVPADNQLFTAIDNGNGTWSLRNGGNSLTLVGVLGGYWDFWQGRWVETRDYSYAMTTQNGWDGSNNTNYNNQLKFNGSGSEAPADIYATMGWGSYPYSEDLYLYLDNGVTPKAGPQGWAGHFTFWKEVEVESEIDLPDYWTITNTPKGNGNLEITKTLPVKEDSSPATFVFSVKATFRGETVYDDIVTLTFDKAGSQTAKIEGKIPADAEVEVKEIYGGAAYSVQGDDTVNVTVLSNDDASAPATAAFEDTYNSKELTSGYGVLNTYTMGEDARWIVNGEPQGEQPEDKN